MLQLDKNNSRHYVHSLISSGDILKTRHYHVTHVCYALTYPLLTKCVSFYVCVLTI